MLCYTFYSSFYGTPIFVNNCIVWRWELDSVEILLLNGVIAIKRSIDTIVILIQLIENKDRSCKYDFSSDLFIIFVEYEYIFAYLQINNTAYSI